MQLGDESRQFYRLTPGKKMIVMLGGPSMNLLIYIVLSVILFTALGTPHDDATTTVSQVIKCVVPATAPEAKDDSRLQDAELAGVSRPACVPATS